MATRRLTPTKPKFVFLMMGFLGITFCLPVSAIPMEYLNDYKVLMLGHTFDVCNHCDADHIISQCRSMGLGVGHGILVARWDDDGRACVCPCTTKPRCPYGQNQNINLDVSPMIHPSRRFVQFYINNNESKKVWCRYIKVYVNYRDIRDRRLGRRMVTINNVILKPNVLEHKVEAGQEIIDNLEAQYDTPRIYSIYEKPVVDCCY